MKKHGRSPVGILLLSFLLLFIISGCNADKKEPPALQSESSEMKQTQDFEAAVEKLTECFADISSRSQMIFRRDKEIPINSDPESYKIIIQDGITTCEKWESVLAGIGPSEDTKVLLKITRQYITNQKMFFRHLLSYVEKRRLDDLDLSNKYSHLAAENMKVYTPELVKTLDKNHYVYDLKNGYVHFESKLQ